jgi:hypothetical protein
MSEDRLAEATAPRGERRLGPILGVILALAASAGLAWWFATPQEAPSIPALAGKAPATRASPARPPPSAPAKPEEAQVRRAYDAFQDAYADGGAPGVARARQSCAQALAADPRILDYCLAFDMFAAAMGDRRAPAGADAERQAAARAALPSGSDPALRIAEVGQLAKLVSLGDVPEPPVARAARKLSRTEVAAAPRSPPRVKVLKVRARPDARGRVKARQGPSPVIDACLFEPTAADRLVCGNPRLADSDRRMRRAYEDAIAGGADRSEVDADQARWRSQRDTASDPARLQELYEARTRDLQDLSPPH